MYTPPSYPSDSHELPKKGSLWELSQKILEILENDELVQSNQDLTTQIKYLQDALEAKSKELNYDYSDYFKRLFYDDAEIEHIIDKEILSDAKIFLYYTALLERFRDQEWIKKRLRQEMFEDLCREIWTQIPHTDFQVQVVGFQGMRYSTKNMLPTTSCKLVVNQISSEALESNLERFFRAFRDAPWLKYVLLEIVNIQNFSKEKLQAIFSHFEHLIRLDLPDLKIGELDAWKLQTMFSPLFHIKSFDLSHTSLDRLDEASCHAIFSHLYGTKSLRIQKNSLWLLDVQRLHAIFSPLSGLREICMWNNDLEQLDEACFHAIFSHLTKVKYIDLSTNNLWVLDAWCLRAIFSNLWTVKTIDLSSNMLWSLNEEELDAIFSHLDSVVRINLTWNTLCTLSASQLEIIFSHLRNVKHIDLRENYLWELWIESLNVIFSNLRNVETMDLYHNLLSRFDDASLESIFWNLKNIQKIHVLESKEFLEQIIAVCPYMEGKIINV